LNLFEIEGDAEPVILLPALAFRHGQQPDFGPADEPIDAKADGQEFIIEQPDEDLEKDPLPPVEYPKNSDFETAEPDILIGPDGRPPRKRERHQKVGERDIVEALRKSGGYRTQAAKMLGITYDGLAKRIQRSPDLRAAEQLIEETSLDFAESKLMHAIRRGEPWAIKFHLETKGAVRGYVKKEPEQDAREQDFVFTFEVDKIVDQTEPVAEPVES